MSWFTNLFSSQPSFSTSRQMLQEKRRGSRSRVLKRDMLHGVVRECMVDMGVLTAHFKFKVLALDADASRFIVMVDLSDQVSQEMADLAGMEVNIVQRAMSHHSLSVSAVYWRMTDKALVQRPPRLERASSSRAKFGVNRKPKLPTKDVIEASASGFPITELPDGSLPNKPLGSTQYGDL
jgi:hypothetical protein